MISIVTRIITTPPYDRCPPEKRLIEVREINNDWIIRVNVGFLAKPYYLRTHMFSN